MTKTDRKELQVILSFLEEGDASYAAMRLREFLASRK